MHWNKYEALRDSLRLRINNVTEPIEEELQRVGLQVDGIVATAEATQTQVTALQTSIDALPQQVAELRALLPNDNSPLTMIKS